MLRLATRPYRRSQQKKITEVPLVFVDLDGRDHLKQLHRDVGFLLNLAAQVDQFAADADPDGYHLSASQRIVDGLEFAAKRLQLAKWELEDDLAALQRHRLKYEHETNAALEQMMVVSLTEAIDPRGFFVYCLWGDDEQAPIYVGQSTNILHRLGTHMGNPVKRQRVRSVTLIRCLDEREMMETEDRLIAQYQPEMNKSGVR